MSHGDRVADRKKGYVVPPRVQSDLLVGQHRIHPSTAHNDLNAETFAAHVWRTSYLRCRDQLPAHPTRYRSEHFNVDSLGGGTQHGYARGKGSINITGHQTCHQSRSAANQNGLRFDAVLSEDPLLLGDPETERAAAERCRPNF